MPALLEVTLHPDAPRPRGLPGVSIHGLAFSALERAHPALSARVHAAPTKPFRVAGVTWTDDEVRFQVGVLSDELTSVLQDAFAPGVLAGRADDTLRGEVRASVITASASYRDLYERHLTRGSWGRALHWTLHTPLAFHQSGLDVPFPIPRLMYRNLQRRWEAFTDLHFGPHLEAWVEASVRVQDYKLFPRRVHFKGNRESELTGSVGNVTLWIARPGTYEPGALRLLSEYANYAGVGYKTTFGLGHVTVSGWRERETTPEEHTTT